MPKPKNNASTKINLYIFVIFVKVGGMLNQESFQIAKNEGAQWSKIGGLRADNPYEDDALAWEWQLGFDRQEEADKKGWVTKNNE